MAHLAVGANVDVEKARSLWLPALLCVLALMVESYMIFHDLDSEGSASRSGSAPLLAFYRSGTNDVRHKNGGTIVWDIPAANSTLYREDAIATMSGARAVVEFLDHSEIVIEPDSMIIFEEAPSGLGHGQIVARLVRGSIVRRKSGKWPLYVKFSGDPKSDSVRFDDVRGDAIFHIVHREHGIEVIVESGAVKLNQRYILTGEQRAGFKETALDRPEIRTLAPIPAPRLITPKVRVRVLKPTRGHSRRQSLWRRLTLWSEAWADPPNVEVLVDFAWEVENQAKSYHIQISDDPDFRHIIREESVSGTTFGYRAAPPPQQTKLYFRVAGIDSEGRTGEYSPAEEVTIRPEDAVTPSESPRIQAKPKALAPEAPRRRRRNHEMETAPIPSRTRITVAERAIAPRPAPAPEIPLVSRFEAAYGIIYQSRKFKNAMTPQTASGGGFVPARLSAALSLDRPGRFHARAELEYLLEEAVPKGFEGAFSYGVGILQLGTALFKDFSGFSLGLGPYLATTSQFNFSPSGLGTSLKLLAGADVIATNEAAPGERLDWEVRLAPVFIGTKGADLLLRGRRMIFKVPAAAAPGSWLDRKGPFAGLEAESRWSGLETTYGGGLELGYLF